MILTNQRCSAGFHPDIELIVAPFLSMLNSCSAGVSVVNIDDGFGAAYVLR